MIKSTIIVCAFALMGCTGSTFLRSIDLQDSSYSADARQRFIVSSPKSKDRIICAEPSPDVMAALSLAIAASAKVEGKGGGQVSSSLSESVAAIGLRTATIQLLRDGLYRACEAYQNGALNEFGYALILNHFDDVMLKMMSIEGITSMRPAAQVAIGTKGTAKAAGDGNTDVSSESKSAIFDRPTVNKFNAQEIAALGTPLMEMSKGDGAIATLVGACLSWLSGDHYVSGRADHDVVKNFCSGLLMNPEVLKFISGSK